MRRQQHRSRRGRRGDNAVPVRCVGLPTRNVLALRVNHSQNCAGTGAESATLAGHNPDKALPH